MAVERPQWPARPPGVPAFEHLAVPGSPRSDGLNPAAGDGHPTAGATLPAWVVTVAKTLVVGCVAAAVLAPVALLFNRNEGASATARAAPFTTAPPSSTTRPPSGIVRPVAPTITQPAPTTTTVVPGTSPATQKVCDLVQDTEAQAVLGAAVASRIPGTTRGFGPPMDACVISAGSAGDTAAAQLVLAVGDDTDFLLAEANEPTASNLGLGDDSYVARHARSSPRSVALGLLQQDQSVILEVIGSKVSDDGVAAARPLLVAVRSRL